MERHIITPEAMKAIEAGLEKGENWIVYNSIPYFLERGDVFCFKGEDEAKEFAHQNISDWDLMNVFYARSIGEAYKEITSVNKDKRVGESFNHSTCEKDRKDDDCRKQRSQTPPVKSNQPKMKKEPENSLLPKKSRCRKRGLHNF